MFKTKNRKLIEVFIIKFNEEAMRLSMDLKLNRDVFKRDHAGSTRMHDLFDFISDFERNFKCVIENSALILDRYLRLIKPRAINIEKFYLKIKPIFGGHVDGHIRSLNQEIRELKAANSTFNNAPIGFQNDLNLRISRIENNSKKNFEKKIKDLLFDYNLVPLNLLSRIKEQFILIILGAIIGAGLTLLINYISSDKQPNIFQNFYY